MLKDVIYAVRLMAKTPALMLAAIAGLALGIGANTIVFSLVSAVLIRPLPYQNPDRLVWLWEVNRQQGLSQFPLSPGRFRDWRAQTAAFSTLAGLGDMSYNLTTGAGPERLLGLRASASLFKVLGAQAALGRGFADGEDQPGAGPVVVLSDRLWRTRFSSDPAILGRKIVLNGQGYTAIGIMPRGFWFPTPEYDLWTPLQMTSAELSGRGAHSIRVIGRLKDGVTREQAGAELGTIAAHLAQLYPQTDRGWTVELNGVREQLVGGNRLTVLLLFGAVGVVLLIACANVATLLVARAMVRRKEMSIRTALGASWSRVARQVLTESLVLALAAAAVGFVLAIAVKSLVLKLIPHGQLGVESVPIDWRVLVFTILAAVATGVVFGLAPAIYARRLNLAASLSEAGRQGSQGGSGRGRRVLVGFEIALAFVLLISGGLLLRSFWSLSHLETGFRSDHLLTMQMALPDYRYKGPEIAAFYGRLLDSLSGVPGVRNVAIVRPLPLSGSDPVMVFDMEDRQAPAGDQFSARYRAISPGYFGVMGVPVKAGREFAPTDGVESPGVVIVNETMARRFWPGADPVGKRIRPRFPKNRWCTVVGVAADVHHVGLDVEPRPEMYYLYSQIPEQVANFVAGVMYVVARTGPDPLSLVAGVRTSIASIDPHQPVFDIATMDQIVSNSVARPRFSMALLVSFSVLGLLLASIGVYSVLSYLVARRRREIGIRYALGATRADVVRLVLREVLAMVAIGLAVGYVASLASTRLLSTLLYNVSPQDGLTYAVAALVLLGSSVLASLIPIRRATALEPSAILRYE